MRENKVIRAIVVSMYGSEAWKFIKRVTTQEWKKINWQLGIHTRLWTWCIWEFKSEEKWTRCSRLHSRKKNYFTLRERERWWLAATINTALWICNVMHGFDCTRSTWSWVSVERDCMRKVLQKGITRDGYWDLKSSHQEVGTTSELDRIHVSPDKSKEWYQ